MVDNAAFRSDEHLSYNTFCPGDDKVITSSSRQSSKDEAKSRTAEASKVELQKNIGFISCVGIIVGTVIGSGIFISPKGVLLGTGSVGLTLIVWLVCGFFSFMGCLCFVELGTLLPVSGGIYMYNMEGFAPSRKTEKLFWGPLPGFLYSWQQIFFSKPAGFSVQAMSMASYLMKLNPTACIEPTNEDYQLKLKITSLSIMTTITAINCFSVNVSTKFINFFLATKLIALACVIIGGTVVLIQGTNEALRTGFEGTNLSVDGLTSAMYSGLWAYAGWDNLNFVAREVKNPEKNIVRSIIASILLVTVIYLLTNISYFALLSKDEFLQSNAVAVEFATKLMGYVGASLMTLSVVCSIFGSSTGGSFVSVRITYAAAREGHLMNYLSFLNVKYRTPMVALIFSYLLSVLMIWSSNILSLINLAGFLDASFLSLTMISLLIMRKTKKDLRRPVKIPLFAPLVTLVFSIFLIIAPFVKNAKVEYFYILLFLLVGAAFYTIFVYYEVRIPGTDKLRKYIQIVLEVVEPQDEELES